MGVREIKARQTACIKFLGQKQYFFGGGAGGEEVDKANVVGLLTKSSK